MNLGDQTQAHLHPKKDLGLSHWASIEAQPEQAYPYLKQGLKKMANIIDFNSKGCLNMDHSERWLAMTTTTTHLTKSIRCAHPFD